MRPETVESVFIAWRVTRDPKWRLAAWDIFTALKRLQVKSGGFHGVVDVRMHVNASSGDNVVDEQPSYFLAETLKYVTPLLLTTAPLSSVVNIQHSSRYLFLTFDDPERLSLDDWVSIIFFILSVLASVCWPGSATDVVHACLMRNARLHLHALARCMQLMYLQVFNTECHPFRLSKNHSDWLSRACRP